MLSEIVVLILVQVSVRVLLLLLLRLLTLALISLASVYHAHHFVHETGILRHLQDVRVVHCLFKDRIVLGKLFQQRIFVDHSVNHLRVL